VNVRGAIKPRVRSMSMLCWVGGRGEGLPLSWSDTAYGTRPGEYRIYRKYHDMINPGPARTFVFLYEREDSINDGMFVVDMRLYPQTPESVVDWPANYHGGAGGFSFADGHSEIKKWITTRFLEPPLKNQARPFPTPLGGELNKDVQWMQQRATRRIE